jgi:hypothetical protein
MKIKNINRSNGNKKDHKQRKINELIYYEIFKLLEIDFDRFTKKYSSLKKKKEILRKNKENF